MSVAASRYARALMDVLYPNKAEVGLEQLQKFTALLDQHPEARQIFENLTISAERRKALLAGIAETLGFDVTIRNFLGLLIERDRVDLIREIVRAYQQLLDEKLGVVRARITSAFPLDSGQQQKVAAKLRALTGREVRMEVSTDPSLIGGLVAQVGGTVYDGSIRHQLQSFRNRLTND